MSQVIDSLLGNWTAVDLVQRFGPIPLARVRMNPAPGTATEQDLVAINERKQGLCELVDGTLVEKTVGWYESYLAVSLAALLHSFVRQHGLGLVLGADGPTRLMAGLVRVPDVAFYSASSLPQGGAPRLPFMPVAPTLAVEVISLSNTRQEMDRKLREYFTFGVSEVWYVYPVEREIHRYLAQDRFEVYREGDLLATAQLLPGFELDLEEYFRPPNLPVS
jgi:Uma2 family endonuclease